MQTIELVQHLDDDSFRELTHSEAFLELLSDDIEYKTESMGYYVLSWGDWYRYGIHQTLNQAEYHRILSYTDRKKLISHLIELLIKNMRKWFSKNEEVDPTRVRQRVNYNYLIEEWANKTTEEVINCYHKFKKILIVMIYESVEFAKKIRRKIYHFFNQKSKIKTEWLNLIRLIIRGTQLEPRL